jgi:hypothetical protein
LSSLVYFAFPKIVMLLRIFVLFPRLARSENVSIIEETDLYTGD